MFHLSSYSFHILVMTFAVETADDWPVFLSAVRIFVSATEGHTRWFNRLDTVDCVIKMHEMCVFQMGHNEHAIRYKYYKCL